MKRIALFFLSFLFVITSSKVQGQSPDEFLGYELGSRFTNHAALSRYFREIARQSKNMKLIEYGKTYEGRDLMVAVVSSEENIKNIEQIRINNLSMAGMDTRQNFKLSKQPAILWLSYGVHGNEASPTETALQMLYTLVSGKDASVKKWLEEVVVLIDPCLNPDGRERFVNDFNSVRGLTPNPDPLAREHSESWPGGRVNHYYFDLNRDWAWQTQVESECRIALYNRWMPQVHVDFHEQSYNEPYYFAPAAEPIHQDITAWQRTFQMITGKNNARYFDEHGWSYFTKERFDLLYPSYGDTYPLYNGAVGMTYEQGGIKAGLSVITDDGDTLRLRDRITHHFTSGMSTLEMVAGYREKLLEEFKKYFQQAQSTPPGIYRTFIVKADNLSRIRKLSVLLKKNQIEFAFGGERTGRGYSYESQQMESFKIERNDLVVNVQQPKAVLANVLFEPQTTVTDSNTYDITAWALPYAYGLRAYASKENFKGTFSFMEPKKETVSDMQRPYAWAFEWTSMEDVQLLLTLHRAGIRLRVADEPFTTGGRVFNRGTILVFRAENEKLTSKLSEKVSALASGYDKKPYPIASGYVDKGKDLGSTAYRLLPVPNIALLADPEVSAQNLGEIWQFFEQELNYPIMLINAKDVRYLESGRMNILVVPEGNYSGSFIENISNYANKGGKIILLGEAVEGVAGKKGFDIKKKEQAKPVVAAGYSGSEDYSEAMPGAILKVQLNATSPLGYGLGKSYYILKTDNRVYQPLAPENSVGLLKDNSFMAGLIGKKVKDNLNSGLLIGTQTFNKGRVVYLADNPLFRMFWESGKMLLANALFLF